MAVHSGSGKSSAFLPTMSKIASRSCVDLVFLYSCCLAKRDVLCAMSPVTSGDR